MANSSTQAQLDVLNLEAGIPASNFESEARNRASPIKLLPSSEKLEARIRASNSVRGHGITATYANELFLNTPRKKTMTTTVLADLSNRIAHLEARVNQLAFFHELDAGDTAVLQEAVAEISAHLDLGIDIDQRSLAMTQEVMAEQDVDALTLETAVRRTGAPLVSKESPCH